MDEPCSRDYYAQSKNLPLTQNWPQFYLFNYVTYCKRGYYLIIVVSSSLII